MTAYPISRRLYLQLCGSAGVLTAAGVKSIEDEATPTTIETTSEEEDVLVIDSGETYTVSADTVERFDRAVVDGTLSVAGRLELAAIEDAEEVLVVSAGETYTIDSGTTERFERVEVDGTLNVVGTLEATG